RHLKSTLDAQHILPCHCEECVSTTSQSYDIEKRKDIGSRRSFQSLAMTCIEDKCERSGLYSNSVLNAADIPHPNPLLRLRLRMQGHTHRVPLCGSLCIPEGEGERVLSFSIGEKVPEGRMRGFTLAEVLITLGIIGVVAAMTIPTLMQKTNDKDIVAQLSKDYSVLSQAWKMVEMEYGTIDKWGLNKTATGTYDSEHNEILDNSALGIVSSRLREHLNVKKEYTTGEIINNNQTCFLNGSCSDGPVKGGAENSTFELSDGSIVSFGWYNTSSNSIDMTVALPAKNKYTFGENKFYFLISPKGVMPEGYIDEPNAPFFYFCKPNAPSQPGRGCTAWVIYNKNLDYKYCASELSWNGKTKCD
ncbi:type II secretion system protein, partial [bacterium]|nr:type II secretion system protein [bacterium]